MNTNFRVVLDACVLANFGLCDLFLTLAETPRLYQPVWNREILDEVQRTHVDKLGWPEALSKSWREAVESAFPEAIVTVPKSLVAVCANHKKDRHVLATAVRGRAELIVTSNLKQFPRKNTSLYRLFFSLQRPSQVGQIGFTAPGWF